MCRLKIALPFWYFFLFLFFNHLSIIYRRSEITRFDYSSLTLFIPINHDRSRLWSFVSQGLEGGKKKKKEKWTKNNSEEIQSHRYEGKWMSHARDTKTIISVKNFWMLCYDDRWKKRLASATSFKARRTRRVTEGYLLRYTRSNRSIDTDLCLEYVWSVSIFWLVLPACPFIANLSSRVVSFFFPLFFLRHRHGTRTVSTFN